MAFEYGYSVERADALVLWEAQFGDFANGAQIVIDEFISSAEQKWGQRSSVVLLLPHGYEGQGPDHSSARIERYLQLCAENNMTVARPSTPASYFHLLRRQAYARPRRPLIVFTPKSMLRLRGATSEVADFTNGKFEPVIDDARIADKAARRSASCCTPARSTTTSWRSCEKRDADRYRAGAARAVYPLPLERADSPCSPSTRTPRSSGRRRSRRTRAPGRSSASSCAPTSTAARSSVVVAGGVRLPGHRVDEAQRAGAGRPDRAGADALAYSTGPLRPFGHDCTRAPSGASSG